LRLLTETAASGDTDSQAHAVEVLQGFYLPGAMRASLAAVPLRTRSTILARLLLARETEGGDRRSTSRSQL
jgi:hypothetical protein